ncbi:hypothetical protein BW731_04670 [Vagococcus martis]|uniref:Uncharacterized protein n=1 Tax=Vagococcus martis TaxID=1768210 RepID=A0A1V4DG94_9ENTE|nr:PTS sugar transporter subunit IIA [Vagococcus martis]OPF87544.1 hypothetical protein BW731_04670 [Vagococcus martis]
MLKKREKKLLHLLIKQNDFQPASFFKDQLSVSTKTIYGDLDNIDFLFKSLHIEAKLIKKPRKGIKLELNEEDISKLNQLALYKVSWIENAYTTENRKLSILGYELFSEEKNTYSQYAEKFYVSAQTIKNDIDEIVSYFKNKQVNIYDLEQADESVIQNIAINYIKNFQKDDIWSIDKLNFIFDDQLIRKVEFYIEDIISVNKLTLSNYMKESLKISLLVFISRVRLGYHLEEKKKMMFSEIQTMELYMSSLSLIEKINNDLGIFFSTDDTYYLSSSLFSHGIQPFSINNNADEYFRHQVISMISQMNYWLKVDLSTDDLLIKSLISHIVPMIHRLKTGVYIRNPLLQNIKKQYSTMYSLVQYATVGLEESLDVSLPEDEIGFLTIHFQLAYEKIEITKHVLIVCSFGFVTSELILNRIERNISNRIILEVSDERALKSYDLEQIDLIISTVSLDREVSSNVPVIFVSPLPSNEEISSITSRISTIDQFEQNFSSESNLNKDLLITYSDNQYVYLRKNFDNKEEILTFLSNELENADKVTNSFRETLFQREINGSTEMDIGVAFPHADPRTVKETKIVFLTLAKPIKWNMLDIQIVCLVLISEDDMGQAKNIIATLYDLFKNQKKLNQLIESKCKKEFKDCLTK